MDGVLPRHLACQGFPGGGDGKETACSAEDAWSIPGSGRSPGEGHGNPLQHSCLENPHGQRSLVGCSPWGCEELDTTETNASVLLAALRRGVRRGQGGALVLFLWKKSFMEEA